ncbi:MAG: hypothetical protein AAGL29_01790 [Bacteroidota bacterium]
MKLSFYTPKTPFFSILTLLTVLAFVSGCGDDDGDNVAPNVDADVVGVYDLVEINVSQSLDIDDDGNSSSNLLEEVSCITGTLTLSENNQWTLNQSNVSVTTITGGLFFADCAGTGNSSGTWSATTGSVVFNGGTLLTLASRSDNRLTNTIGEDLPSIQSYVYLKR